jgi:hypothetical protein
MKKTISALFITILVSQLSACGKSQAVMCSEISDQSSELTSTFIGKLDEKAEKEMKESTISMCMKMPEDTIKAQHKMLVK